MVVDDVEDFCAAVIGEMPVCDVGLPASERVLFFGGGISRGPSCRTTSAEHRRACRSDSVGLGVGEGLTVAAAFRACRPSRAARRRGRPATAQDLSLGPTSQDLRDYSGSRTRGPPWRRRATRSPSATDSLRARSRFKLMCACPLDPTGPAAAAAISNGPL